MNMSFTTKPAAMPVRKHYCCSSLGHWIMNILCIPILLFYRSVPKSGKSQGQGKGINKTFIISNLQGSYLSTEFLCP